jgi:hypothetical protein
LPQIRFYHRDRNLDNAQMVHVLRIPRAVSFMSTFEDYLIIYTIDNLVRIYRIAMSTNGSSFQTPFVENISLASHVSDPYCVQSIHPFWPATWPVANAGRFPHPLLVLESGRLCLFYHDSAGQSPAINRKEGGEAQTAVADKAQTSGTEWIEMCDHIEAFWLSEPKVKLAGLVNSLWAFDGVGAKVWLNLYADPQEPQGMRRSGLFWKQNLITNGRPSLDFESDFYPLSACAVVSFLFFFFAEGSGLIQSPLQIRSCAAREGNCHGNRAENIV